MAKAFDGFTCFWKIKLDEDFTPQVGDIYESLPFKIELLKNSKWSFELALQSDSETFMLIILKEDPGSISLTYSVSMLTYSGWGIVKDKSQANFKGLQNYEVVNLLQWKNFQYVNDNYLKDSFLVIRVHMFNKRMRRKCFQCILTSVPISNSSFYHLPSQELNLSSEDLSIFMPFNNSSLTKCSESTQTNIEDECEVFHDSDQLLRLFKKKKFGYVTLRTEKKEFAAHKALLCTRSPVFCAMFENNMKENESNIVNIDDVDSDTLSILLQFLYLEPLKDLNWNAAIKLYYAADKYQIELLKKECILFISRDMSVENICETFLLSSLYEDENLRQTALNYFCKHFKSIFLSDDWDDFKRENTELATEILCEFSRQMCT